MQSKCQSCGECVDDGEEVTARIRSTYHRLNSDIAFALDRNCEYIKGSLRHVKCPCLEDDKE